MKKVLAVVHSYYMLLVVIQLRLTEFSDDSFDIILTDDSKNYDQVFDNMRKSGLFNNCYLLKSNMIYNKKESKIKKFINLYNNMTKSKTMINSTNLSISSYDYDILLSYVADRIEEQTLFNIIKNQNKDAVCQLYEESYVSYYAINGIYDTQKGIRSHKLLPGIMKCIGKKNMLMSSNIDCVWCFDPRLIQYKHKKIKVNAIEKFDINNKENVNIINQIFGYDPESFEFDKKYIYLEDSAYVDNHPTDDIDMVKHLADRLGKENFMVKLHPRTKDDRFATIGFTTNKSTIPLELIFLNQNLDEKVFITIGSAAPLTCLVDFDSQCKVIMLYKCSKYILKTISDKRFQLYIDQVKTISKNNQICIMDDIGEVVNNFIKE